MTGGLRFEGVALQDLIAWLLCSDRQGRRPAGRGWPPGVVTVYEQVAHTVASAEMLRRGCVGEGRSVEVIGRKLEGEALRGIAAKLRRAVAFRIKHLVPCIHDDQALIEFVGRDDDGTAGANGVNGAEREDCTAWGGCVE